MASSAAPKTVSAMPEMSRRLVATAPGPSDGRSVSAATGGIRTAFLAGPIAETTVTSVPTRSPTIAVRGSNVSGPVGRVALNPLSSASSPIAATTPRPTPTADEASPMIAASARTERSICLRLAPTTRSRASSRVRWPTMIENVL